MSEAADERTTSGPGPACAEPEPGPRSLRAAPAGARGTLYDLLRELAPTRDVAHESWVRLAQAGLERQRARAISRRRALALRFEVTPDVWEAAPATVRRVRSECRRRRRRERPADLLEELTGGADELQELVLRDLFEALARRDPRACRIATLRCEGLSIAETALEIGASTATVKRVWRKARLYLLRRMGHPAAEDGHDDDAAVAPQRELAP